ncbi:hypothetical protein [Streptomyces sp. CBG30]|uniref:hypothetical protein n=1 Tax=Streptomyces sp. CBG30 TaxID=2838869 RepID=UPI002036AF4F|nr:hypothetical protein [Streptomyces sp. CBG30]
MLERRRAIVQFIPLEPNYVNSGQPDHSLLAAELLAWVNTEPNLTQAERVLLNELAGGHDAVSLADRQAVPLQRMRERVSRARRRARALWQAAVGGGVTPIPVRLSPTLVRSLIPPQRIGTYVLYAEDGRAT